MGLVYVLDHRRRRRAVWECNACIQEHVVRGRNLGCHRLHTGSVAPQSGKAKKGNPTIKEVRGSGVREEEILFLRLDFAIGKVQARRSLLASAVACSA